MSSPTETPPEQVPQGSQDTFADPAPLAASAIERLREAVHAAKDEPPTAAAIAAGLTEDAEFRDHLALAHWMLGSEAKAEIDTLLATLRRLEGVEKGPLDTFRSSVREIARDKRREEQRAYNEASVRGVEFGTSSDVREALEGLAIDPPLPRLLVPDGWEVYPSAIVEVPTDTEKRPRKIAERPILITALLKNAETLEEVVRVGFPRHGRWQDTVVPRGLVKDARSIVKLSEQGAPITSVRARDVVSFLDAFEAFNEQRLPRGYATDHLGWQGDAGSRGFAFGHTFIGHEEGTEIHLQADPTSAYAQVAEACVTTGTWEGWQNLAAEILKYPVPAVCLYGALIPPLLTVVPAIPSFSIELVGDTSEGKTTTLQGAGSSWFGKRGVQSWNASQTAIERHAAFLHSVPFMLDDSSEAWPGAVERVTYMMGNERGKGRGTPDGLRRTADVRNVLLSTGEQPLHLLSSKGGALARCLAFWGSPFGGTSNKLRQVTNWIKDEAQVHHGHAGPRLVTWLHENRDRWGGIATRYVKLREKWGKLAGGSPVASRAAAYVAAVELAGEVAHRADVLPKVSTATLDAAWAAVERSAAQADVARIAFKRVGSWVARSPHELVHIDDALKEPGSTKPPPPGGWKGFVKGNEVCIDATECERLLTSWGYDSPHALLRTWADRGWMKSSDKNLRFIRSFNGWKLYCNVLDRAFLDAVMVDQVSA